ncbi:hypothetical protein V5G98_16975 [Vibrio cholerae]|uniref:hypothetical protein n=1 Tax=Vibrio cholerae TaxID=666 RepID=UPI0028BF8E2D|nr:hypothetical protein [Vibrio vulnificus]
MSVEEVFMWGVIGGILPEALALYKLRRTKKGERPDWLRSGFYWAITIAMVCLGGLTALVYQKVGININELAALHLGAATPLVITSIEKKKPHTY